MSQKRNETLKKRYQVYRRLGYNSKVSRALSQRSLDVSQLEISTKTGKLKANTNTKQYIEIDMREWKRTRAIDNYKHKTDDIIKNRNDNEDTVYTNHGMLIHDKRYKGESGRIVSIIKNSHNLTTDQAYFFFYSMNENNWTYSQAKKQLLSNQEFEIYVSKGKR